MRNDNPRPEQEFREGPRHRRSLLVSLNDRVAVAALRHHFEDARIPFQCECGDLGCREFALYSIAEYRQLRETNGLLLCPAHG